MESVNHCARGLCQDQKFSTWLTLVSVVSFKFTGKLADCAWSTSVLCGALCLPADQRGLAYSYLFTGFSTTERTDLKSTILLVMFAMFHCPKQVAWSNLRNKKIDSLLDERFNFISTQMQDGKLLQLDYLSYINNIYLYCYLHV